MKLFFTILVVTIAAGMLVAAGTFTDAFKLRIHPDDFVNGLMNYQLFAITIGGAVTLAILVLNPESRQLLSKGQLGIIAEKEPWLGINGNSSWKTNGLQLMLFISLATGAFMFFALKGTNSLGNFRWGFIPLVIMLSFTNSLAEELIFRFGIVGGLFSQYPKPVLLILSAVFFGLPHYSGWPGGLTGILMAGILGYILCKATIETKGLSIALTIHFVQDIIIFTALLMMQAKQ